MLITYVQDYWRSQHIPWNMYRIWSEYRKTCGRISHGMDTYYTGVCILCSTVAVCWFRRKTIPWVCSLSQQWYWACRSSETWYCSTVWCVVPGIRGTCGLHIQGPRSLLELLHPCRHNLFPPTHATEPLTQQHGITSQKTRIQEQFSSNSDTNYFQIQHQSRHLR